MSDEREMIIRSIGVALRELLDESCVSKYSLSEELFQDVNQCGGCSGFAWGEALSSGG